MNMIRLEVDEENTRVSGRLHLISGCKQNFTLILAILNRVLLKSDITLYFPTVQYSP